jgi:hypothetical protein
MPSVCQDWASHIKIPQIPYLSHIFSGKKTLANGESKTWIYPIDACETRFDFHKLVW